METQVTSEKPGRRDVTRRPARLEKRVRGSVKRRSPASSSSSFAFTLNLQAKGGNRRLIVGGWKEEKQCQGTTESTTDH
jgi:hypothetical protein